MSTEDIKRLIEKGFNPNNFNQYRMAYNKLFHPKTADTCNCNAGSLYNQILNKLRQLENEEMSKNNLKNPNQQKNEKNGKFEKVEQPVIEEPKTELPMTGSTEGWSKRESTNDFITKVKQELLQGYYNTERVTRAYRLIMNNPEALGNNRVMRTTILNHSF